MDVEKSSFERILSVLLLEEPDRIPLFELYVDLEVIEVLTNNPLCPIDLSKEKHRALYLKMLVKFFKQLGFDYVPFDVPINLPKPRTLSVKDLAPLSLSRKGLRAFVNENRGVIETPEDFEQFQWPEVEIADYDLLERLCRMLPKDMRIICGIGTGGVMEEVSQLMTIRQLSISLYRNRKLVSDLSGKIGKTYVEIYNYIASLDEVGALSLGDDMGYKSGTMISQEHLMEYVFPWQKRFANIAHKHRKPFVLHSCGNLDKIMDTLISYVGIDAKHSYQDAIEPVTQAKRKYGDRIAILGGVDIDKLVRFSSGHLGRYISNIIKECACGGGYALGSGNSITNYTNLGNYLEMVKMGMKYGKYPLENC